MSLLAQPGLARAPVVAAGVRGGGHGSTYASQVKRLRMPRTWSNGREVLISGKAFHTASCRSHVIPYPPISYQRPFGRTYGGGATLNTRPENTQKARLRSKTGAQAQKRAMSTSHHGPYEAVVVGAGPAGITCVGNLLERKLAPILWVDNNGFDGGRINRCYREVPSNTKVRLFLDYATAISPFRKIVDSPGQLQRLRDMDPNKGCRLSHAADMTLTLTEGLRKISGVATHSGSVEEAVVNEAKSAPDRWMVRLDNNQTARTKRLIVCTGGSPNNDPLPIYMPNIKCLDLDTALSISKLTATIAPLGPTTVAVIGASHSAVLVLMNLYNLASTSKPDLRIRWLTRHPLRYAQEMDGWILRDNTGLKGEAADFARQNLEPETIRSSDVGKYITRIDYPAGDEEGTFEENMPGCNFYVQAIGYTRDPLPMLRTTKGKEVTPYFDHEMGSFDYVKESDCGTIGDLVRLPGMYGAGIAFPERVKDPHGNVEKAVGFGKFMKFVQRVMDKWD